MTILILLSSLILLLIVTDIYLKIKPSSKLKVIPLHRKIYSTKNNYKIECVLEILNYSKYKETMISDLIIDLDLFEENNLKEFNYKKSIHIINDINEKVINNYWPTIIVKANKSLKIKAKFTLNKDEFQPNNSLWIKINWENYGHFGLKKRSNYYLISNHKEYMKDRKKTILKVSKKYKAIALKTALLGAFDDPIDTICDYCEGIIMNKDILIIGETPLAIMQGRYLLPKEIEYNLFSKILCYFFHPTSSLATACGIQLLINKIGVTRTTFSLLVGFCFKLIGIKGIFYRLAGRESSLIDDISGTTVPYDKTIVLGPKNTLEICKNLSKILKIHVAVVDVNDLGGVKILASSNKLINPILRTNLKNNPAGNDDQKTPIVLIRENT